LKCCSLNFDLKEKTIENLKSSWKKDCCKVYSVGLLQGTIFLWIMFSRSYLNMIRMVRHFCLPVYSFYQNVHFVFPLLHIYIWFSFCLFRIDEHFKTSPKIPGIDLNSTRVLFEKLMNSQHSMILEQVCCFHTK
jgi:hypothetical protein